MYLNGVPQVILAMLESCGGLYSTVADQNQFMAANLGLVETPLTAVLIEQYGGAAGRVGSADDEVEMALDHLAHVFAGPIVHVSGGPRATACFKARHLWRFAL
jgi:hypothetical protein